MTRARAPRQPPDGVLLRVPVAGAAWAEGLPPVPDGADVSVSFSCADAAAEHADAVALLGYRVVGVQALAGDSTAAPLADFLVAPTLACEHPAWWGTLAGQADRVFSLALGPVLATVKRILERHLQPLR